MEKGLERGGDEPLSGETVTKSRGEFIMTDADVLSGKVACAHALLMRQRALVDHGVKWMEMNLS